MDRFVNRIMGQAAALDQTAAQPRFGVVASVDPVRNIAKVRLQPEDVLSGWLPILSPWVGAGWGLVCPPQPGQQVLVLAQEGAAEHGVIAGAVFGGAIQPPGGMAVGELWLTHASGSFLRLRNDGSIQGQAAVFELQGDLRVQGDVFDRHGSLSSLRQHYDTHRHLEGNGATTSVPDQQD